MQSIWNRPIVRSSQFKQYNYDKIQTTTTDVKSILAFPVGRLLPLPGLQPTGPCSLTDLLQQFLQRRHAPTSVC